MILESKVKNCPKKHTAYTIKSEQYEYSILH